MRWVKNALLVLFTLALVAAGAVMPFAASRVQDAQQTGVEFRSFDSFSLTLKKKGELGQIMRFLTGNAYYEIMEGTPEKAVMSEEEVLEAAKATAEMMLSCGIISKETFAAIENNEAAGVDRPDIEMARIVSETDPQNISFIIWGVDWYNLDLQLWIDDASGKAFQIVYVDMLRYAENEYDKGSASSTGMTKEQFHAQMENWRLFLENYYEMEVKNIEEIPYSFEQNFLMYIDLEDGGDQVPMRVLLHEDGATLLVEYHAWTK